MKLLATLPAALTLLAGIVSAASPQGTYKTQVCYTSMESTKPKTTHSYTKSTTTKNTKTQTKTTTKTVTPKAITKTSTSKSTKIVTVVGAASTGTATATQTGTKTNTVTTGTVTTSTVSITVDGGVQTVTVSANSDFRPIYDTVPGSSYERNPTKKQRKRNGGSGVKLNRRATSPNPSGGLQANIAACKYAGDVTCTKYYEQCTTSTVWHTATCTAQQPTVSVTVTSICTSTLTTVPGVPTGSTQTASTTTVTTVTTTDTSTTTVLATTYSSTSSSYAACATNNIAEYVNGLAIVNSLPDYKVVQSVASDTDNPYDCCVMAILDPLGTYWAWDPDAGTCLVFESKTTCAAGKASKAPVVTAADESQSPVFALGNAYCGAYSPEGS